MDATYNYNKLTYTQRAEQSGLTQAHFAAHCPNTFIPETFWAVFYYIQFQPQTNTCKTHIDDIAANTPCSITVHPEVVKYAAKLAGFKIRGQYTNVLLSV